MSLQEASLSRSAQGYLAPSEVRKICHRRDFHYFCSQGLRRRNGVAESWRVLQATIGICLGIPQMSFISRSSAALHTGEISKARPTLRGHCHQRNCMIAAECDHPKSTSRDADCDRQEGPALALGIPQRHWGYAYDHGMHPNDAGITHYPRCTGGCLTAQFHLDVYQGFVQGDSVPRLQPPSTPSWLGTCQRGGVLLSLRRSFAASRRTPSAGRSLLPRPAFAAPSSKPLMIASTPWEQGSERGGKEITHSSQLSAPTRQDQIHGTWQDNQRPRRGLVAEGKSQSTEVGWGGALSHEVRSRTASRTIIQDSLRSQGRQGGIVDDFGKQRKHGRRRMSAAPRITPTQTISKRSWHGALTPNGLKLFRVACHSLPFPKCDSSNLLSLARAVVMKYECHCT